MRPLYSISTLPELGDNGHRGLWFDKFCDQWRTDGVRWSLASVKGESGDSPKIKWLKSVCKEDEHVGDRELLRIAKNRLAKMTHHVGGKFTIFKTESRFVTGLGRANPIENGLAWHHTLGTPFLPGSSIKGLVRAWAQTEASEDQVGGEVLTRIFGAHEQVRRAGSVSFLAAIPIEPVRLEIDVITPHAGGWNPDSPPGDWRSPVPIPFLVTAPETLFLFCVVPATCRIKRSIEADLDQSMQWLIDALSSEGGGAKTAVGYGRMRKDSTRTDWLLEDVKKRADELAQNQAMSTLTGYWPTLVNKWSEAELLNEIRENLENNKLTDDNKRRAFVAAVREIRSDWVAAWRKGQKIEQSTKMGPKKLKERAQLINNAPNS